MTPFVYAHSSIIEAGGASKEELEGNPSAPQIPLSRILQLKIDNNVKSYQ